MLNNFVSSSGGLGVGGPRQGQKWVPSDDVIMLIQP